MNNRLFTALTVRSSCSSRSRRFSPSTRLSPAEGRRAERRRVEGVGNDGGKVTSLATSRYALSPLVSASRFSLPSHVVCPAPRAGYAGDDGRRVMRETCE